MAITQQTIQEALREGHSMQEIQAYIRGSDQYKEAVGAGHSDADVMKYFGLGGTATSEALTTLQAPPSVSAAPDYGITRIPRMIGQTVLGGLAQGFGTFGNVENLIRQGAAAAGNALGLPGHPAPQALPTSAGIAEFLRGHGLVDQIGTTPQNELERLGVGAVQGGTSALALSMLVPGAANALLPQVTAGAGGGIGGEIGRQVTPQSTVGPLVGSLLGGMVGGPIGGVAAREQNAIAGNLTPRGQLVETAGLPPSSAALTSGSPTVRNLLAPYAPLGQINQNAGTSIETTAAAMHRARTLEDAGTVMQQNARDWLDAMPARISAQWAPVDQLVGLDAPAGLSNLSTTLQGINTSGKNLQGAVDMLRSGASRRMENWLDDNLNAARTATQGTPAQTVTSPILNQFGQPITTTIPAIPGENLTWGELQKLRSQIGDAMANPTTVKDVDQATLANMYRSLTADMRQSAFQAGGQPATAAFDAANAESERLYGFAGNTLGKVVADKTASAADPEPGMVAKKFLAGGRTGGAELAELRGEMPESADALGAVALRQNGLADATDPNAALAPGFVGKWAPQNPSSAILSPEAKSALFAPETLAHVNALTQIAGELRGVTPASSGGLLTGALGGGISGAGLELGRELLTGGSASPLAAAAGVGTAALPFLYRQVGNFLGANPSVGRAFAGAPATYVVSPFALTGGLTNPLTGTAPEEQGQ